MTGKELITQILNKRLFDSEITVSVDTEFDTDVEHTITEITANPDEETGTLRVEESE